MQKVAFYLKYKVGLLVCKTTNFFEKLNNSIKIQMNLVLFLFALFSYCLMNPINTILLDSSESEIAHNVQQGERFQVHLYGNPTVD